MAMNAFIKFTEPDIKGESTDSTHSEQIQVLSWSHSFNQPTKAVRSTAGGGTVEQANHSDFTFSKYTDAATDDLLKYCWNGKQIGKALLQVYRADGNDAAILYMEIEMEDVIISNVSIGGGQGDLPTENISLAYGKVTYKYKTQKPDTGDAGGVQPVSHDLIKQVVS
ncbi:type VI secretion system tube protein Hcp [Sphingomonas sp.]|uniref:Hcp family type VI secretion system effector n=1 Tax=Sphingomonas sp. TaxID=28214 RepID=UPI0028AF2174|nr:type VI secretion system tube protein Hcp [Sphingomonas sp.]